MVSSEFRQRLAEAKKVSIYSYLKEVGFTPQSETGSSYLYVSPLRGEKVPSFNVSKTNNHWKDFGTGETGDLLDLVQKMENCSLPESVDKILGKERTAKLSSFTAEKRERKNVEIVSVGEITSPILISYLSERRISLNIAKSYLKELEIRFPYGKFPERISKVLGFKNDSGGWEMRSKSLKISNSPKNVTTIVGQGVLRVYEGHFSFLSAESLWESDPYWSICSNSPRPKRNSIILNSLSFLPTMMEFWSVDTDIWGFLDNDKAGDKATDLLKSKFPLFQDMRDIYKEYNDYNDFICGKKKIKTIKEVLNG